MSIVTPHTSDRSNFLCKRFASLASTYFEHPAEARNSTAQVPLENLFRVLEMYRNDTFSDERRKGLLAFESRGALTQRIHKVDAWHTSIKDAVHKSIVAAFPQNTSEQSATEELQRALRWLAADMDAELPDKDATVMRAKTFFSELSGSL